MTENTKKSEKKRGVRLAGLPLFGNLKVMAICAMFTALSVVLGKYLSITTPLFRISFENLSVLLAGVLFGPVLGGVVGGVADIVGCLLVGYTINPLITAGGVLIGVVSGLISWYAVRIPGEKRGWRLLLGVYLSVLPAHIIGSMAVKSLGLYIYFKYPVQELVLRIPLYIVIAAAEGFIIYLLLSSRAFIRETGKLMTR